MKISSLSTEVSSYRRITSLMLTREVSRVDNSLFKGIYKNYNHLVLVVHSPSLLEVVQTKEKHF
jgi:predicted phosphohydrolase